MGLFVDLMYPDNGNRQKRVIELTNDCSTSITNSTMVKDEISILVATANDAIKRAYESMGITPPGVKECKILDDWAIDLSEIIMGIVAIPLAMCAIKWAFKTGLLKAGKITIADLAAEGAAKLIKVHIPKFWRYAADFGAAIVITVALEAVIDSIEGAVQRKQLKSAIGELVQSRVDIKKVELCNNAIIHSLRTVVASYNTVASLGCLDETQLNLLAAKLVEQNTVNIQAITLKAGNDLLAQIDKTRSSWTNEDGSPNLVDSGTPPANNSNCLKTAEVYQKDKAKEDALHCIAAVSGYTTLELAMMESCTVNAAERVV